MNSMFFHYMGAGLLSFVLSYTTKMSPPEIREASFGCLLVKKSIVSLPYRHFPYFRWWSIQSKHDHTGRRGLGPYWGGQNWNRIFEKTRVGFGRTELSLRLSCTEFCALSSGHGPRGQGFEGFSITLDFHDFFGGSKMGKNMKMQDEHGQISISGALDPRKMNQNDLL